MIHTHRLELFACRASENFAKQVIDHLNTTKSPEEPEVHLGELEVTPFSDGEFQPQYAESVRGASVYILQSTIPPADNLMELLLAIDAAKRASADEVVAVMPYFGWARQDRKDRPRVSIASKLVANMLTAAGCDRVMTCELHAAQIQGFFDIPVDHLWASSIFIPYIQAMNLDNLSIASPDMGGAKKANIYARHLNAPLIICHKDRTKANVVGSMTAIGEIEGRNVVIVDDMVDTAGTITKCAEVLMERGALSVRAVCTHPILSGPAYDRIYASPLQEFIVADTIPLDPKKDNSRFTVLSMTGLFAKVIDRIYHNEPVSDLFIRS